MAASNHNVAAAVSGPGPGAGTGPRAINGRGRGGQTGHGYDEDAHDADEDDHHDAPDIDMISRSLPTSGGFLEPETASMAMLSDQQQPQHQQQHHQHAMPSEHSPLLQPSASSPSPSIRAVSLTRDGPDVDAEADADPETDLDPDFDPAPFLNGTSTRRFWSIFAQILTVQFIGCFDGTIMASSHPVITSYFGAANSASWLSTAFLLTSTAFQPLLGRLSDTLGRKPLFLGSLCIFAGATVWCALAGSIESFIVARAFCGLGAGGTMTVGSIITSDLVPIERRGSYQSYMNMVYGASSALGAAVGGAMAEALGWRWEFGVQVPALLLCLAVSAVAIPDDLGVPAGDRKSMWAALREFDTKGSLLLTMSVSFLILGLNLGGNVMSWSHPFVITSLAIFVVCFPSFLLVESRVDKPIMPLRLITHAPRANLIFANFCGAFLANAIFFNIPLYFQAVLLMSATDSGLRLVIPTLVSSVAGTFTGFAISWTRRLKWPLLCGTTGFIVGTICLASLRRNLPPLAFFLTLIPSSLGGGFQFPGTFMAILASSPQSEQAVVSSTLILWRSLGMVLGVAVSSLILQNALVYYLDAFVQGPRKEAVIAEVRASVEAIARLEMPYREQVIRGYEAGLRLTYMFCVLVAIGSFFLIWPIKLDRLPGRRRGKGTRRRVQK
ncbi:hypothetical protein E4U21_005821 [Claviceps maximensis]|nr:hypothetical protein E4U21_005821 [Claviceps maximensis]